MFTNIINYDIVNVVITKLMKKLKKELKIIKITLKNSQNTICFEIIFCSEISKDENLLFINNYLENFSKREKCEFLSRCATALSIVLRQDFERFYLDTIMEMGKIPHNFIVLYDDEKVADISSKKEQYKSNPKKFTLGPYRTLK